MQSGEIAWKISFPSRDVGYVSVEHKRYAKVLKTMDGGVTWQELIVPNNRHLQAVGFISPSVGWVGGHGGTSFTTDGGDTWTDYRRFDETTGCAVGVELAPQPVLFRPGAYLNRIRTSDRLYFASRYFGIVRAFDVLAGQELWRSEIQNFVLSRIGMTSSGACCTSRWTMLAAFCSASMNHSSVDQDGRAGPTSLCYWMPPPVTNWKGNPRRAQ